VAVWLHAQYEIVCNHLLVSRAPGPPKIVLAPVEARFYLKAVCHIHIAADEQKSIEIWSFTLHVRRSTLPFSFHGPTMKLHEHVALCVCGDIRIKLEPSISLVFSILSVSIPVRYYLVGKASLLMVKLSETVSS
jgi:hypothetical protein